MRSGQGEIQLRVRPRRVVRSRRSLGTGRIARPHRAPRILLLRAQARWNRRLSGSTNMIRSWNCRIRTISATRMPKGVRWKCGSSTNRRTSTSVRAVWGGFFSSADVTELFSILRRSRSARQRDKRGRSPVSYHDGFGFRYKVVTQRSLLWLPTSERRRPSRAATRSVTLPRETLGEEGRRMRMPAPGPARSSS